MDVEIKGFGVCVYLNHILHSSRHRRSSLGCGVENDFYPTTAQSADSLLANPLRS